VIAHCFVFCRQDEIIFEALVAAVECLALNSPL